MSFANKSFSLFQRDVILFIANLCTSIVIARKLGPEAAGLWAILLLIPGYAEAFGRLKFDIAAVYFLGKKKSTIGEMIFLLHVVAIITSMIIITIFICNFDWFYNLLYRNSIADMRLLSYFVLAIIPLRLIFLNYSYLQIAMEDVRSYNAMLICQAFITSFVGILMVLVYDVGIIGVLIGNILGPFVSILYASIKFNITEKIKPNFNISLFIEMGKYSFHQYISGIISYLQITLTDLFSAIYFLPAQVAFFSMSKSISDVSARMIPAALNILLISRVSKLEDSYKADMLTAHSFRVVFIILFTTWLLLSIFIKPIVFMLYGTKYYPMIGIFRIVFPAFVLNQSSSVFTSYFSGIGRSDLLTKVLIFPLLIQVFLIYILIYRYGLNGAAYAFLISSASFFIVQVTLFIKLSSLSIKAIVPRYGDFVTIYGFIAKRMVLIKDHFV